MFRAIAVILSFVLSGAILAQEAESRAGGGGWTTFTDPSGVLSISMDNSVREDSWQMLQIQSTEDLGLGGISLCNDQAVWSALQIYVGPWSQTVDFQMPVGVSGPGFYFQLSTASVGVRTAAFEIKPQPTITDFWPQTAASGQEVTVFGYGFDAFNCANLYAQDASSYYYTGDIPATMWDDGTIHFTMPQSVFVRSQTNGALTGQVPLESLKEVSLQMYAGSDGWSSNTVNIKIVSTSLNISMYQNADGSNIFTMGQDILQFVVAGENFGNASVNLVKTQGTKSTVPICTIAGAYQNFEQSSWSIPTDIAAGTYVLSMAFGDSVVTTPEFSIVAPYVPPEIVYVPVPTTPTSSPSEVHDVTVQINNNLTGFSIRKSGKRMVTFFSKVKAGTENNKRPQYVLPDVEMIPYVAPPIVKNTTVGTTVEFQF